MLIRQLLLIAAGASYGLLSAAGVFTVLVAVGLIPRFAGKTHTARYVLLYEEMVIFGTLAGCFVTVFPKYSQWGSFLREQFPKEMKLWMATGVAAQAVFGLFSGMFIGCLALAIAEMLDSIPIFARRIFVSAWSGMGGLRDGGGENLWVSVLFCHRTAPDRTISRELPSEGAVRHITGKYVHAERKMRDGRKREAGYETAGGLSEM